MNKKISLSIALFLICTSLFAQTFKLFGKVTNTKLEPVAYATIQVRELNSGIVTKEDGTYEVEVTRGKYDLIITMIGYEPQKVTVVVTDNYEQNIILTDNVSQNLDEVVIKVRVKDRAEEVIRNVIKNKAG